MTDGQAQGFAVYRQLLSMPHAARVTVGGVIAQAPAPLVGMGVLLAVRAQYDSFTIAGTASAATAVCFAVTSPIIGRLIDRYGQRRVGVPLIGVWCAAIIHLCVALWLHAPVWVIIVASGTAGLAVPFGSMMRARWNLALRDEPARMNSALSMISVAEELMWTVGTPLATVISTLYSPFLSIGLGALCLMSGGWAVLGTRAYEPVPNLEAAAISMSGNEGVQRAPDPAQSKAGAGTQTGTAASSVGRKETLLSPAVVALLVILIGYGAFQSTIGLSVIAFSEELNQKTWSGAVLACFSAGAMFGALFYGARTWQSALWKRFYGFLILLACGCSALLLATSMPMAAVLMLLAGAAHAPTVVNINQLLMRIAPASRLTEGMALMGAMWVIGQSVSNVVTGQMIDNFGSQGGFSTTIAFAVLAMLIALVALRSIRAAIQPAHAPHTP